MSSLQHLFNKVVGSKTITFRNNISLTYVQKIVYFKEVGVVGAWLQKEFRYTFDLVNWSPWNTLTQQALSDIDFDDKSDFYLEVKYTRDTYLSADIDQWYLFYEGTLAEDDPSTLIDADLLNGFSGLHYLYGGNFFGPAPNVNIENLPLADTSTGGIYSHKVDSSLYTTFYFRSIGGEGGISVRDASDELGWNKLLISVNASVGSGENLGGGDASVLFQNIDNGSGGITMRFREIKGSEHIVVSTSDNVIVLDASDLASLIYVDGSLIQIREYDAIRDISIGALNNYNSIQDSSISYLDSSISYLRLYIDGSLNTLSTTIDILQNYVDGSLNYLSSTINTLQTYVDGSLITLQTDLSILQDYIDGSISTLKSNIDTSLNNLRIYIDGSLVNLETYVDNNFTLRDAEIAQLDASVIQLRFKDINIDVSLNALWSALNNVDSNFDTSLNDLRIYIDGSINNLKIYVDSSLANLRTYIDSSLVSRDVQISQLNSEILEIDSSILQLKSKDASIDVSLNELWTYEYSQDSSIVNLRTYVDSSLVARDAEISQLDSSIIYLKSKDASIDVSLNELWIQVNAYEANDVTFAYVDGSLLSRDSEISQLDSSVIILRNKDGYIDVSLNELWTYEYSQDSSLVNLKTYIDASLISRDAEISQLDSSIIYLKSKDASIDVSLNELWTQVYAFEANDVTFAYVDGSLDKRDTEISQLDSSIIRIDTKLSNVDISLNNLWINQLSQDTDISNLQTKDTNIDASLNSIWSNFTNYETKVNLDSSFNNVWQKFDWVDTSLNTLGIKDSYIDTSLNELWIQVNAFEANDVTFAYVDGSLLARDAEISQLDSSIVYLKSKDASIDVSLNELWSSVNSLENTLDSCINYLRIYVDGSLIIRDDEISQLDSSIVYLKSKDASIDASLNALWAEINSLEAADVTFDYIDGSLSTRDSSIIYNLNQIYQLDSSIIILQNKDGYIDVSLNALWDEINSLEAADVTFAYVDGSLLSRDSEISQLDSSIVYLKSKDASIDASLNALWAETSNLRIYIDGSLVTRDVEISQLDSSIIYLKSKDASIDVSLNELWSSVNSLENTLDSCINELRVYIDGSLTTINTTLDNLQIYVDGSLSSIENTLDSCINELRVYVDGSLVLLNNSINELQIYVDGSLSTLDASLEWLYSNYQPSGQYVTEASLGSNFIWVGGYLDVSVESGFTEDSSILASKVYYDPSSLSQSLAMPSDVGGIPAGTTVADLNGDTVTNILNDLLFPTVNPTYVAPSSSFVDNVSNLQEVGDVLSITYTTTFNRGQILINGVFQDYRSGLPSGYYYTDPSSNTLLVDVSSSLTTDVSTINGYIITEGTQSWTAYVDYLEGPQPYDNKGNSYESPLPAGSTTTDTVSIEGVYPIFATTSSITTLTQQSLVSMISGNNITYTLVTEVNPNRQRFDLPDPWIISRPLSGIQTYNTVAGSWDYQGSSQAASLTYWDTSTFNRNIQGNSIGYTRYTYNSDLRSSVQIRLVF